MERFCACAPSANAQSASTVDRNFISILLVLWLRILAQPEMLQRLRAARFGVAVDLGIETRAVAVQGDEQRTEAAHAELPQRFRIEVVEVDVLDRFDPGGLERSSAADDGEIRSAEI